MGWLPGATRGGAAEILMQKLEKAGEPTMEEILASIRQIISEEPAPRPANTPAPAPVRAPAVILPPPTPTQSQPMPAATAQKSAPGPVLTTPPPIDQPHTRPAPLSHGEMSALGATASQSEHDGGAASPRPTLSQPAQQASEPVGLSDSLNGPPRRPSAGLQHSMIGVAPTAEQYSRSMWRFGKRPDPVQQPTITLPEPPRIEPAEVAIPADAPLVADPLHPPFAPPPLSLPSGLAEEPRNATPVQPQTRPPTTDSLANYSAGRMPSIIGPATRDEVPPQLPPATANRAPMPLPVQAVQPIQPAEPEAPLPSLSAVLPPPPAPGLSLPTMDARSTMTALAASLAGTGALGQAGSVRQALADQSAHRPVPTAATPASDVLAPPRLPTAPAPSDHPTDARSSSSLTPVPPVVQAMIAPVKSLEDVVVELLRPMLRQWLDENMPRIVEKSLRVELAEQLKKPKS